ncbi:MAG: MarR family transcriptional regulator [Gemmatimonadales bacterium]
MTVPASSVTGHKSRDDARTSLRTWLRLLACTNLVEREVRGRLRDRFDTTLPRFDVLAQLDAAARESKAELTMSDLSRRLMVTNGNLTSLVERLVREGLVKRETLATDRRTQIVRLTPLGKRSLDAMTPEHQRWIDSLFADLTPSERTRLYELLGKLRTSVQNSLAEEGGK